MRRLLPAFIAFFLITGLTENGRHCALAKPAHSAACAASCQPCRHAAAQGRDSDPAATYITVRPLTLLPVQRIFSEEIFHPPAA